MTVTVCVVVKDRRDWMRACLAGILAERPDQVVVVDNGSTDGTWELLVAASEADPRVVVVQDRGNLGRIRNRAVELATGHVVAFTDSDCVPHEGWLAAGLAAFTDGVGLVQGRTVPAGPTDAPWSVTQDIAAPTGLYEACNVFYRRDVLLAAGGFGEDIGFFGEDTVAGWRVERAGWEGAWAPDAVVEHVVTTPGFGWHLRRTRYYGNWAALMREFPEKRRLLWHGVFLRQRSAETDVAVLATFFAIALTTPWPLPLALPFLWRHVGRHWRDPWAALTRGSLSAVFDVAVSLALVRGSVRHGSVVL